MVLIISIIRLLEISLDTIKEDYPELDIFTKKEFKELTSSYLIESELTLDKLKEYIELTKRAWIKYLEKMYKGNIPEKVLFFFPEDL